MVCRVQKLKYVATLKNIFRNKRGKVKIIKSLWTVYNKFLWNEEIGLYISTTIHYKSISVSHQESNTLRNQNKTINTYFSIYFLEIIHTFTQSVHFHCLLIAIKLMQTNINTCK